jgi:hypothetical protein
MIDDRVKPSGKHLWNSGYKMLLKANDDVKEAEMA